jgi:membrane fusion protein, multidrug efflux system
MAERPNGHCLSSPVPHVYDSVMFLRAFLLVLISCLVGCNHDNTNPVSAVPPSKVNLKRNVELCVAEQRALQYAVETPGVLEAERVTDIAAGVSGIIDEVFFREGDNVTPDTVMILVDQKRFQTQLDIATANEMRMKAALQQATDAARRAVDAGAAITQEERTRTHLAMKTAEAELAGAEANRRLADIQLARSRVRPPYAGRINQRKVTAGMFIEEKGVVGTIADVSQLRLVGWVPESASAAVRQRMTANVALSAMDAIAMLGNNLGGGLACVGNVVQLPHTLHAPQLANVEFTLLAYPREKFRAKVFYMSTIANPETHMFESKSEIYTTGLLGRLQPGYTARIRFPLRTNPDACVVPEESVRPNERGFVAFVPIQRTNRSGQTEWVAQARIVELGYREPGWVEVKNGIKPGETLVRRGAEALEDGTPINMPEPRGTRVEPGK